MLYVTGMCVVYTLYMCVVYICVGHTCLMYMCVVLCVWCVGGMCFMYCGYVSCALWVCVLCVVGMYVVRCGYVSCVYVVVYMCVVYMCILYILYICVLCVHTPYMRVVCMCVVYICASYSYSVYVCCVCIHVCGVVLEVVVVSGEQSQHNRGSCSHEYKISSLLLTLIFYYFYVRSFHDTWVLYSSPSPLLPLPPPSPSLPSHGSGTGSDGLDDTLGPHGTGATDRRDGEGTDRSPETETWTGKETGPDESLTPSCPPSSLSSLDDPGVPQDRRPVPPRRRRK